MGTLPEATDNSSLTFEIQREKRTTHFKEYQSMGGLSLKIDILCRRSLALKYF